MTKNPADDEDRRYDFIIDEVTEKILRVLLENPRIPYNKSTLAEVSGVSRDAMYRRWEKFEELNIIEDAPTGGSSEYYRLNVDSEVVEQLGWLLYLEEGE